MKKTAIEINKEIMDSLGISTEEVTKVRIELQPGSYPLVLFLADSNGISLVSPTPFSGIA